MMVLLLVTGLLGMVFAGTAAFYLGSSLGLSVAIGVIAANLAVAAMAGLFWARSHLRTKETRRSGKGAADRDRVNVGHVID
jgi:hypothetical protein